MNIGILVPLPQELASLTQTKITPGDCIRITENITVCLSGVGRKQTKIGFEQLLKYPLDLIISWGSAAGLNPQLSAGDLLIPRSVVVGNEVLSTHDSFNQMLISHLPGNITMHLDPITQCPQILASAADKEQLFLATDCVAADMESGAVAQLANQKKISFAVVRSVSDEADMPLPMTLLNSFRQGEFHMPSFLGNLILHPGEWPQIAKLKGNFTKVKKTLIIVSDIIKKSSDKWR